jgi:hypothetical protein
VGKKTFDEPPNIYVGGDARLEAPADSKHVFFFFALYHFVKKDLNLKNKLQ